MYLAHDLKMPLASPISYLNLLRDEKQISEELREKYLSISLAKAEQPGGPGPCDCKADCHAPQRNSYGVK